MLVSQLLTSFLFTSSMKYLDTHYLDPGRMLLISLLIAISSPNLYITSSITYTLNSILNTPKLFLLYIHQKNPLTLSISISLDLSQFNCTVAHTILYQYMMALFDTSKLYSRRTSLRPPNSLSLSVNEYILKPDIILEPSILTMMVSLKNLSRLLIANQKVLSNRPLQPNLQSPIVLSNTIIKLLPRYIALHLKISPPAYEVKPFIGLSNSVIVSLI